MIQIVKVRLTQDLGIADSSGNMIGNSGDEVLGFMEANRDPSLIPDVTIVLPMNPGLVTWSLVGSQYQPIENYGTPGQIDKIEKAPEVPVLPKADFHDVMETLRNTFNQVDFK